MMRNWLLAPLILLITGFALSSCGNSHMSNDVIAQNDDYIITGDSVIQGRNIATALSATHIVSNYVPADSEATLSRVIKFRLALNGHDNEMAANLCHYAIVGCDTTVAWGQPEPAPSHLAIDSLKSDSRRWTLKVDMGPVMRSFQEQGYYVATTGDTIFKSEFKGVWIAGNMLPMTWNFNSLTQNSILKLTPMAGQEHIFAITLSLLPPTQVKQRNAEWKIEKPNPNYAIVSTGQKLIDALYNMSIQSIASSKAKSIAHQGYSTPLNSHSNLNYPIMLSLAYLDPQGAIATLKSKVHHGEIDRSHNAGSAWPIYANDLSWAAAAWEIYAVTGNRQWLNYAYQVIKKTVDKDYDLNCNQNTHLLHGGLRFTFTQSQYYPSWMRSKDIYESQSLTTNILYQRAFEILNDMSDELGIETNYGEKALLLKDAINETLWNEMHGYYCQYIYVAPYPVQSPGIDNLGQALSVLWNVASDDRAEMLIMRTPTTHFGIPTASPHYESLEDVNLSETISPTIQALWNLAAAKTDNEHMLRRGLGALYRSQALFCAHQMAWNAYNGEPIAPSTSDLGCATANVSMMFRVFAGMTFLPNGIEFNPFVPIFMKGVKHIDGFKYRHATLDITIMGTGNDIESIAIDGKEGNDNFFPASLHGHHTVFIKLRNKNRAQQEVTVSDKKFRLPQPPIVRWNLDNTATILNYDQNTEYRMVVNGVIRYNVSDTTFVRHRTHAPFSINALIGIGKLAFSYLSKPHYIIPAGCRVDLASMAQQGTAIATSKRKNGMIEAPATPSGSIVKLRYHTSMAGSYFIDLHYANGDIAPECPTMQVLANTHPQGTLVLPATGQGEWLNMHMSNMIEIELLKGENEITLQLHGQQLNPVLIDYARIIKK